MGERSGEPGTILIRGGRVLDPSVGLDETADVLVADGRIEEVAPGIRRQVDREIDAAGLVVCPGLVDIHVHLREPGQEEKETIATGARAAVAGGFTTVCAMPNTTPPLDSRAECERVYEEGCRVGAARVLPIGCVSRGRAGEVIAPLEELAAGGACAFSDDGDPVARAALMREAIRGSGGLGRVVTDHCEDRGLSGGGVMYEGETSRALGLPGIPGIAEDVVVARNIVLAEDLGARVHIAHISTARSVELVRQAQRRGVRVSAEVCPHHLVLTDAACRDLDPARHKMHPPLASEADRQALIAGLLDGTIQAIASDHAPHTRDEKAREWAQAPNGVIGLESTLPIIMTDLVLPGILTLPRAIELLTSGPVACLGLRGEGQRPASTGTLEPGVVADLALLDLETPYVLGAGGYRSRSANSPFTGREVRGLAREVLVGGRVVGSSVVEAGTVSWTFGSA